MKKFTLKIDFIKDETADTKTFFLRQPALKKLRYQAGQYITVMQNIDGRLYKRPYSFSSAPSYSKSLAITVKKIEKGIFSNYMHSALREGDLLQVYEPSGSFVANTAADADHVVLWGVGSGITPLYSIICEILANSAVTIVDLIYGSKNRSNTIFFNDIVALQEQYPTRFKSYLFYSNVDENQNFFSNEFIGRINFDVIKFVFLPFKDKKLLHYICGPNAMKTFIEDQLIESGVLQTDIFTESFQNVVNKDDFADVEDTSVLIILNGRENVVFVPKGQSILEAALDNNIDIPYSCQVGNCSSCVGVCSDGNIKVIGMNDHRDDLLDNQYLLCCSFPITNNVTIIINNLN